MNLRQVLLVAMAILGAALPGNAEDVRQDGNWWRLQIKYVKSHSVADILDKMTVGPNLAAFGMTVNVPLKPGTAKSYNATSQTFVRITGAQLVDGLDKLYSDNRNGDITLSNAVTVVAHGAAGMPRNELAKMIEQYRKNGC